MIDLKFKIILLNFLFMYYTNKKNNTLKVLFGAPSRVRTYINKNYGNLLMVSPHGLEPWTHRLRVCCSTN